MKKTISVALVLIMVLCALSGCAVKPEKAIIGTWTGSKDILIGTAEYSFTFNEDGTGSMSTPGISLGVEMKYTITDNNLSIVTTVLGISQTNNYTMEFTENTLVLTGDDGAIVLTKAEQ